MTETGYEDMLAGRLHDRAREIAAQWETCRTSWRDAHAAEFERKIIEPVLEEIESTLRAFRVYGEAWARVKGALADAEIADFDAEETSYSDEQDLAEEEWQDSGGSVRTRFGLDFGEFAHWRSEDDIVKWETARGRRRNVDYGVEYTIRSDDEIVRYDYVDLVNHIIVDFKSARAGESEEDVAQKYSDQCERHKAAYAAKFGVTPDYQYIVYPSTADLFRDFDDDSKDP